MVLTSKDGHRKPKNEHDFKHLFLILQQEWTF